MKRLTLFLFAASVLFPQAKPINDSAEIEKLLKKDGKVFFLDVREAKEIEELGSIKGYVNIPIGELQKRMNEVPKDRTIITA